MPSHCAPALFNLSFIMWFEMSHKRERYAIYLRTESLSKNAYFSLSDKMTLNYPPFVDVIHLGWYLFLRAVISPEIVCALFYYFLLFWNLHFPLLLLSSSTLPPQRAFQNSSSHHPCGTNCQTFPAIIFHFWCFSSAFSIATKLIKE